MRRSRGNKEKKRKRLVLGRNLAMNSSKKKAKSSINAFINANINAGITHIARKSRNADPATRPTQALPNKLEV
jgi:hypothetical protein